MTSSTIKSEPISTDQANSLKALHEHLSYKLFEYFYSTGKNSNLIRLGKNWRWICNAINSWEREGK